MKLSKYFWYFKSALTPRFCDEIIKYGLDKFAKECMAFSIKHAKKQVSKSNRLGEKKTKEAGHKHRMVFRGRRQRALAH